MVFARTAARSLARSSLLAGQASPHFARRAPPAFGSFAKRTLTASAARQGKVLLVLYDVRNFQIAFEALLKLRIGQRACQGAKTTARYHRKRTRYQKMARRPGTHPGHYL